MAMWNPWRGCKNVVMDVYIAIFIKEIQKRNINTNEIIKTKDFEKPIEKLKNGNYKMKAGIVYLCFLQIFLLKKQTSGEMNVGK